MGLRQEHLHTRSHGDSESGMLPCIRKGEPTETASQAGHHRKLVLKTIVDDLRCCRRYHLALWLYHGVRRRVLQDGQHTSRNCTMFGCTSVLWLRTSRSTLTSICEWRQRCLRVVQRRHLLSQDAR